METDRVQRKMDIAERDAKTTRRQLEDTCKMHNAALDAERGVRDQLQSTLENVQVCSAYLISIIYIRVAEE